MAIFYQLKCPNCGTEFGFGKGILPQDADRPIPKQLREETPEKCPTCGREFIMTKEEDNQYVTEVVFID